MINAKTRGINCYRLPIMAFYENDLIESDHEKCAPTVQGGCARCAVLKPPLCCSLCHTLPAHWQWLNNPVPVPPPLPRMSIVPTKYIPSPHDLEFQHLLNSWRRNKTREIFGLAFLKNTGAAFVLPDDILARIADCARVGKIDSLDTLFKETKWYHAREYHSEILQLINENYPLPSPDEVPPISDAAQTSVPSAADLDTPVSATVTASADASGPSDSPRTKATRTCGACGSTTHIRSSKKCPKYDKENRPPRRGSLSKTSTVHVHPDSTSSTHPVSSRALHDPASQVQLSAPPSVDNSDTI
ncbi:hypothetical protein NLI96_g12285 [Meripilus lineatus]|uniref:Uncharacterized protein n=1 Tax=Meripilus lineatus TaxID=2056292 RepID=A0AAD5UQ55_9APHY|nr:hypothetical protein NLI96_g12285 [Physisporinus lineatus]